jgi:hypothetical protein
MLVWKTVTDKMNRVSVQAQGGSNADTVDAALVEVWQQTLVELAARCHENEWDVLICQLITQCGMVVIVPARKNTGEVHDAAFAVQFSAQVWSNAYEALPDPDDESRFNKAYDRLHWNQLRALKTAIGHPQLKAQFAALKRRPSFAVFCVDEGDTPIRNRWEFLWGNRPSIRVFATAKELFEHLFHKAEQAPEYAMRIRDDKVVAVSWFGHSFTDRYVDLIEGVPNLAKLCDDVSVFVLTATRVTKSGVERLKTSLPRAHFTVVSDQEFENGVDIWGKYRAPETAHEKSGELVTSGICTQCGGSGKCFCIRKGPGNPTGCARCCGSGSCHVCQGTGKGHC